MKKLISDLDGLYAAKPILVIGGGPSAKVALEKIPADYPKCVISCNEHGFKQDKFEVNYIVSVDFTYGMSEVPMQEKMAQYHTAHINKWSWADYRIPEWNFNGDSGMTAIAVAAMLGGHPVLAIGMDRYCGSKRYFWHEEDSPEWMNRRVQHNPNGQSNEKRVIDFCRGTEVRVIGGAMRSVWPEWRMSYMPPWKPHEAPQMRMRAGQYGMIKGFYLHQLDAVNEGPITLTNNEAKQHLYLRNICIL